MSPRSSVHILHLAHSFFIKPKCSPLVGHYFLQQVPPRFNFSMELLQDESANDNLLKAFTEIGGVQEVVVTHTSSLKRHGDRPNIYS